MMMEIRRVSRSSAFYPVGVGMPVDRDMATLAPSFEMAFDGASSGLERSAVFAGCYPRLRSHFDAR